MENRCGSGVLRLVQKGDLQIGERNIILGLKIPDYPKKPTSEINSGRNVGEAIISIDFWITSKMVAAIEVITE